MELSPDGAANNSSQSSSNIVQHFLSSSQQDDLKQLYSSATELLRHFWSCFPASTPFLQEKVSLYFCSFALPRKNTVCVLINIVVICDFIIFDLCSLD